jgi:hypothetical protein
MHLLRNCALEQLAGFAVEGREAEMGGPLAQAVKDTDTVLGIVGGGPGILAIARSNLCTTRTRPRRDLSVTWPSQGTFPGLTGALGGLRWRACVL